jgi:hypothetical protein
VCGVRRISKALVPLFLVARQCGGPETGKMKVLPELRDLGKLSLEGNFHVVFRLIGPGGLIHGDIFCSIGLLGIARKNLGKRAQFGSRRVIVSLFFVGDDGGLCSAGFPFLGGEEIGMVKQQD